MLTLPIIEDTPDLGIGFSIGISHYHKDKGRSYIQVHDHMSHESHSEAKNAVHQRIDSHQDLAFGVHNSQALNGAGHFSDEIVRANAEYHPVTRHWDTLPKQCALQSCGAALGDDIYIPHVDYARPPVGPGYCYQAVLRDSNGGRGDLTAYDLGFCSLDHAVQGAHHIVDEILSPPHDTFIDEVTPDLALSEQ